MQNKTIIGIGSLLLIIIIALIFFMLYEEKIGAIHSSYKTIIYPQDHWWYKPFRHHRRRRGGCHCMRQPNGGKRGYCGRCSSDGTAFGCGNSGECRRDCSKIRYSGKACDPCRDYNC